VLALATRHRRSAIGLVGIFAACMLVFEFAAPAVLGPDNRAFPSGHATSSMAFVAALFLVTRESAARRRVLLGGVVFVAAVGMSRVAMGVHHPTDVLAGWALSLGLTTALWLTVRAVSERRHAVLAGP
jgi:membrane-associated phospholipid phosphatase